jgi:hypothetical protein
MKQESPSGKYIVVKRNTQFYKIFTKDLKTIKVRSRKDRPPVPAFYKEEFSKDIET